MAGLVVAVGDALAQVDWGLRGSDEDSTENRCLRAGLRRWAAEGRLDADPWTGHGAAVDELLRLCAEDPGRFGRDPGEGTKR